MEQIRELDLIRDYGLAHDWAALVIEGKEIIPAGRAAWLNFVWLSHDKEQHGWVYLWIRSQSELS
jgi:hypothetical protein